MTEQITIPAITVTELSLRLTTQIQDLQLIDVREPAEIAIAHLEGFTVLSFSQFEEWAPKIKTMFDPQKETLVICHHGIRSAQMCQWLLHLGFTNVKNVTGGIDAYAIMIDSSLRRY